MLPITYILLPAVKRWSNSMAQYKLPSLFLKEKPIKCLGALRRLSCVHEMWWKYRLGQDEGILHRFSHVYEMLEYSYKSYVTVSTDLIESIFQHLKDKSNNAKEHSDANTIYKQLCAGRVDLVLKRERVILGWSLEEDFDQSILLWHIATDLLYYTDEQRIKLVSDYMLYLLVMLPDGIGNLRFQDSCAEAIQFFQDNNAGIEGRKNRCLPEVA